MSLGVWIAVAVSLLIMLQIWSGSAWIPSRHTRGRGLQDAYVEHFVYRDDNPRLYWLDLAIQAAVLAYIWYRVLR